MTARPPRVLMLSDVYFPRVNGVSTSIQTFRRDLGAEGCRTTLVAPRYPEARDDEPGVVRVRSRYLPFDPEDRVLVAGELDRALRAAGGDWDLVHVHTPFVAHAAGVRFARRLGVPVVETYHTLFEEYFHHYLPVLPRALLGALARAVSRRQCDAVDAVIAPSPQMEERLRAYGVGGEIRVIPTGLDVGRLAGGDGARFRAQHGIASERPVALTVGRIAFEKNIGFLIDVLERVRRSVPDALLVIAGEGPALATLRREVEEQGLAGHVCFVGYLDRAAAGLLLQRECLHIRLAHRDAGPGAARSHGAGPAGRVHRGDGHAFRARRRAWCDRRQRGRDAVRRCGRDGAAKPRPAMLARR